MLFASAASWAWIPIALTGAALQTARNAAQRSLVSEVGTLGATLVRFLYGIPFAALWLWAVIAQSPPGTGHGWPGWNAPYWAWLAFGALAQILATAFLLLAMKERNFVFGTAMARTEVLQAALFGMVFLGDVPSGIVLGAVLCATLGVFLLAMPTAAANSAWLGRASLAGRAAGASFALASVGYRGAGLALPGISPWLVGAWGVLLAQCLQTLWLGGWIAWRDVQTLRRILRAWRISTLAGAMGAAASICWFTAFALRPVADVKTLGMIEVVFSYAVSRKLFDEALSRREKIGLLLLTLGLAVICTQL
jgi:drug/metabolite transporter (DMT)-like permease